MSKTLKNHALKTTMACPAQAREYYLIESQSSLIELLLKKQWQSSDVMVLGFGSNTIFQSIPLKVVLASQILGRDVISESADTAYVRFGAGENWHECVEWALHNNFYGLENLALIPGLVGAAPIQNIGAYGVELADVFESLRCVDIETAACQEYGLSDCEFAYRESIFKQRLSGKKMITSVTLKLSKQLKKKQVTTLYPALQSQFASDVVVMPHDVFHAVCKVRFSKLPNPLTLPNSGSFFKNPVISKENFQALQSEYTDIVGYETPEGFKLAAGWLIERVGLKGYSQKNGIGCYEKQALVIVNPNQCTGEEILDFASLVQLKVHETFSIRLEIEPRIY